MSASRLPLLLLFASTCGWTCALTGLARADVVHLHDGTTVIGAARVEPDGGAIVVETATGAVDLDAADVLVIEDGARLRASFASLQKSLRIDRSDDALRVVDWAVRKGLFEEAIDLADRALASTADGTTLALPEALYALPIGGVRSSDTLDDRSSWRLLSLSGGRKPATARLAKARLGAIIARDGGFDDVLARGMRDAVPAVRRSALELAAAHKPNRIRSDVLRCLLFDHDESVRATAADTVKAYGQDAFLGPIVRALGQDDPALRSAALDAFDALDDPRVAAALVRHLRRASNSVTRNNVSFTNQTSVVADFDVEIAQAAVIADPIVDVIQDGSVLDVGIAGVSAVPIPGVERVRTARLLRKLTGQDFGENADMWSDWLASNHE